MRWSPGSVSKFQGQGQIEPATRMAESSIPPGVCRRGKGKRCTSLPSIQHQIARPIAAFGRVAVFIVADENLRDCGGRSSLPNNANSPSFPTVPAPTKTFRKDIGPLSQILMLKGAADRLVHVGARLPASDLIFLEPTCRSLLVRPET